MSRRATILCAALAVLAVLASFYVHSTAGSRADDAKAADHVLAVEQLPAAAIRRITLQRRSEATVVFERSATGWTQTQPFHHPLAAFSIDQFIEQAQQLRATVKIEPGEFDEDLSLASFGLDPPAATVAYAWVDQEGRARSTTLALGRLGFAGRAYLQVAGDPTVLLVNQDLHDRAVATDVKEWRERRLFDIAGVELDHITWTVGEQRTILARDANQWMMIEPANTRVDAARLDALLDALDRASASGFILDQPDELSRFGLKPPAASLIIVGSRIEAAGGEAARPISMHMLLIGQSIGVTSQDRFGMIEGRPVVIRIPAAALASLFPVKEALAEPIACGVQPADVKSVRIVSGEQELELERDLDRWIAPGHGGTVVPAAAVAELLDHLMVLRASQVVFELFPLDRQVGYVTLKGFAQQPLDTVRIAHDPTSGNWAMDNGDNVLRLYPAGLRPRLLAEDYGLEPTTR